MPHGCENAPQPGAFTLGYILATNVAPIKTFDPSPATGQPIELREGRYGPYVTDGDTNASVPKDVALDDVTHELAVRLLAERAAAGGGKRRRKSARRR